MNICKMDLNIQGILEMELARYERIKFIKLSQQRTIHLEGPKVLMYLSVIDAHKWWRLARASWQTDDMA